MQKNNTEQQKSMTNLQLQQNHQQQYQHYDKSNN